MTDVDRNNWSEFNQRYLKEAIAWLRLRLEHLIQQHQAPVIAVSVPTTQIQQKPEQHKRSFLSWGEDEPASAAVLAKTPAVKVSLDEQIAQHARAMAEAEAQKVPPALVTLCKRLGLSPFEHDVLLLCTVMELDTPIAALCARAQDDSNRPYPTFALALALFDNERWDVVSPERPLRYWRLIEINQPNAQPLTSSALRADERIVNYINGLDYLDDRLATLVVPLEANAGQYSLPASQQAIADNCVQQLQLRRAQSPLPALQLVGPDALSKQLIANCAATTLQRELYRISADMLPAQSTDLETLARLWHRESLLLPIALYLDMQESDSSAADGHIQHISRFLARGEGVFFLGVREIWTRVGRAYIALDVDKPTHGEQLAAWQDALDDAAADNPAKLAGQFSLNLPTIYTIAEAELAAHSEDEPDVLARCLWDACRMLVRPRLDVLAQRLDLKASWEDLILPSDETQTLEQIADQVGQRSKVYEEWGFANKMNRGLGISVLFAGESGTGKTMAAEVLANKLRLNLYRIDLSAVVSKYIGETEKNLRRLFDAAEDGGAILFFDEADALFGKRSEVKDSHDRYANIEINYLLQRIEAYRGLAILATNMKSALDTAFVRRLRFIVNFPFPGPAERKRMWESVFPVQMPKDKLDYVRLARLNLTGGSIHNVALNAAFMAAHTNKKVSVKFIFDAARAEFRKLERPVNESDLQLVPSEQEAQGVQA